MVKIFITGASGYIGSVVSELALQAGHSLRGLARSDAAAEKLRAQGVEPVRGDLYTLDVLADEAKKADAVLHLAFIHDFTKYVESVETDRKVVETFIGALAGSNKTLVITSGTAVLWDTGDSPADETTPVPPGPGGARAATEQLCVHWQAASRGIRSAAMRLPLHVYGRSSPITFIPMQIATAAKDGIARYIGDGAIFHLGDSNDRGVSAKKIAEAIARRVSLPPPVSVSVEEAAQAWGPLLATLLSISNQYTSARAEKELGWKVPEGRSVLRFTAEGGRETS
ncbi:hypothetical protein KFL_000990250 [Klebsormidium nitens]|uniref:NAD-dependent epimerase/dehydratase domain-containing protein n=1 Tax=Klebsormidium nitens TaxID=105231 RepID=A0A1Y1HTW8_KLENI|nr:hypothetical protein KFL_000990250 [Klebsormidium nitens]|eukprot:GAQ82075.1 hypothetical protein KFL_000990250 [Klebsormidium nitens]